MKVIVALRDLLSLKTIRFGVSFRFTKFPLEGNIGGKDMRKLLGLLNIKKWLDTFALKFVTSKAVKHGATVLAGLLAGLATKYQLDQYGVSVDIPHLTEGLITLFGAGFGALLNWAQKVIDKDGDGLPG